jgi:hypothetical protein
MEYTPIRMHVKVECLRALRSDKSCPPIDAETYGFHTPVCPINSLAMQLLCARTLLDNSENFVSGEYQTGVDGNGLSSGSNEWNADMLLFSKGDGSSGGGSGTGTADAADAVAGTPHVTKYPIALIELKLVLRHSELLSVFGTLVPRCGPASTVPLVGGASAVGGGIGG